jgi:tetrahydromethanopterin S-methyltransferase subunit G
MAIYINKTDVIKHIQRKYVKYGPAFDAPQILAEIDDFEAVDTRNLFDEIEHEADYYDAYVDADIAKGIYMALGIVQRHLS